MAKKQAEEEVKTEKVIRFLREGASYHYEVIEMPSDLVASAKVVDKSAPDVFWIFNSLLEKLARGLFGL